MKEKHTLGIIANESSTSYNTKENAVIKRAYADGSKSRGSKVGFATVFANITRRSLYPHSNERCILYIFKLAEFNAGHREQ